MRRTIRISGLLAVLLGFIVAIGCGAPAPTVPSGVKPAGGDKDRGVDKPLKEKELPKKGLPPVQDD